MKKTILSVVAIAAIVFSACKKNDKKADDAVQQSEQVDPTGLNNPIAFFNIDSLVAKYDMYLDLRAEYETKAKKVEKELTSKGRSLEKEVMDYQDKMQKGLMTRSQAMATEESLGKKQQTFVQLRDKMVGEMAEEEQVLLNKIHYSIVEYLKEFNADLRYSMILSNTGAGPILNANPALDLTKEILAGLNKKYASEKPVDKK